MPFRVSAISFLNPAPLLFDFDHEPRASILRARYQVHTTTPAQCAAELHAGAADLGLIPIAELTPELAVVPGCTIASLQEVRSILLLVRRRGAPSQNAALSAVRTLAADSASRSSTAYVTTLLRRFYNADPTIEQLPADPLHMLATHDAALLIGDPALLASEDRASVESAFLNAYPGDSLFWIDVAQLWNAHTGLPWVAAVWAARPSALEGHQITPEALTADLIASRDAGLAHTDQLVAEWTPRLPLRPETIRTYLTCNIHYVLDESCLQAISTFRKLAAEAAVLPPLPSLRMLNAHPPGTQPRI